LLEGWAEGRCYPHDPPRARADALDVPLDNLIEAASDLRFGEAPSTADALGSSARPLRGRARTFLDRLKAREPTAPPGYVYVARLVRQGGAGDTSEPAEATLVRERFIRTELRGDPGDFLAAEVEGPAMQPVLQSRDEILIDCRRRAPVQPGLFALDQGLGPVVRWVEFVPGSEPPRYRVRSETPLIEPYEVDADAAGIIGRVVWFGRRL